MFSERLMYAQFTSCVQGDMVGVPNKTTKYISSGLKT